MWYADGVCGWFTVPVQAVRRGPGTPCPLESKVDKRRCCQSAGQTRQFAVWAYYEAESAHIPVTALASIHLCYPMSICAVLLTPWQRLAMWARRSSPGRRAHRCSLERGAITMLETAVGDAHMVEDIRRIVEVDTADGSLEAHTGRYVHWVQHSDHLSPPNPMSTTLVHQQSS